MILQVKNIDKEKVQSPQDTYEIMRKIFFDRHEEVDILKEHFWTIALNGGGKILAIELVSMGSNGRTIAEPPEVLRVPLYKSASRLVLVHNHPSGILKPSDADLDLTNRLIQAGLIMNIKIVDHVIVTEHSYYSFCDNDLIEKLRWDKKYALTFIYDKQVSEEIVKIKKEVGKERERLGREKGLKEGKEKGAKAEKIEIAKQMLKKGLESKIIKDVTGLSAQQIGRLKSEVKET